MCGRYASSRDPATLVEEFRVVRGPAEALAPDWNVAPTKPVYAVLDRSHDGTVERELAVLRWGLVPSWAKDPGIGARLINARLETLADKPAFRAAYARRRCLLPADGYFEWYTPAPDSTRVVDGTGGPRSRKPLKQPFFIRPADGSTLALAGLYEFWRDRTRPDGDPSAWWWTATVITTAATDEVGIIHDRMPLLVPPADRSTWLDPTIADPTDLPDLQDLLVPAAPGLLQAYPVSRDVNNVRNNGPQLVRPIDAVLDEPPTELAVERPDELPLEDPGSAR